MLDKLARRAAGAITLVAARSLWPAPGRSAKSLSTDDVGARHGLRAVLDIETARAMADYLNQLRDRLEHGEAVSGPAARRLLRAASAGGTRFEGMFLSPRQVRVLLTDPALQVHDNPRAFLACNYDPTRALCHPGCAAGTRQRPPQPGPVQPGLRQHRPHRHPHRRSQCRNRPAAR